jgi:hypothetical protein
VQFLDLKLQRRDTEVDGKDIRGHGRAHLRAGSSLINNSQNHSHVPFLQLNMSGNCPSSAIRAFEWGIDQIGSRLCHPSQLSHGNSLHALTDQTVLATHTFSNDLYTLRSEVEFASEQCREMCNIWMNKVAKQQTLLMNAISFINLSVDHERFRNLRSQLCCHITEQLISSPLSALFVDATAMLWGHPLA